MVQCSSNPCFHLPWVAAKVSSTRHDFVHVMWVLGPKRELLFTSKEHALLFYPEVYWGKLVLFLIYSCHRSDCWLFWSLVRVHAHLVPWKFFPKKEVFRSVPMQRSLSTVFEVPYSNWYFQQLGIVFHIIKVKNLTSYWHTPIIKESVQQRKHQVLRMFRRVLRKQLTYWDHNYRRGDIYNKPES